VRCSEDEESDLSDAGIMPRSLEDTVLVLPYFTPSNRKVTAGITQDCLRLPYWQGHKLQTAA